MSRFFVIKDNLANKISYYHLMLLMASLPFDRFYSHLILISFAVHTLIHLDKAAVKRVFHLKTLVLQSVFYVTVLSTIYSIDRGEAFNEWGKHITIFLFPLLLCLNPLDLKKYRSQLLFLFALVCTATIIYFYYDAFITIRYYKLPITALFTSAFTNHNFSEPNDLHATFFSMQAAIGLVYFLSVLIKEHSFYKRSFCLICSCILTAGLIQLGSKSIFISLIIDVNIVVPYFLLKGSKRLKYLLVLTSVTIAAVVFIFNSDAFKKRYFTELRDDLSPSIAGATIDSRISRWGATIELIGKSPVIGYGAGSEMDLLQNTFFNKKMYNSYLFRLNAHSEYLSFLIKSGIIGLLVYLITLAFGFNIALRQKDQLFFTFMTLVTIVSLSENLLDVDKGIFFYAFFYSFFVFSQDTFARRDKLSITS